MFMLISPALISTQAALSLFIQNISLFLIGPNPPTNSSSGAYHNYLKDVDKISIDSIRWHTAPMYNQTSFPGSGAAAQLFWHE